MWRLVCSPGSPIHFPDEASGSLQSSVLADCGITFDKATVLLCFDMHYIGTWSLNNRMLRRTVSGYFIVTSKLMFAVSEINVPNLHYAVHILI
jgi:hypothetical protein